MEPGAAGDGWTARTRAIALGRPHGPGTPMNAPIVPVTTYELGGGPVYARHDGTDTWAAAEEVVGSLEGGRALLFASGMAAIAAVLDPLPPGSRIAAPKDCYLGLLGLLHAGLAAGRWHVDWIGTTDTPAWLAALAEHDVVWLESPSNPMLEVADLPQILAAPRPETTLAVVDNTFATPLSTRPLALGADIVVHSATKYLSGHSDALGGVAVTARPDLAEELHARRTLLGAVPGMLEAFLITRGIRTLPLRLEAATANAQQLAERLAAHPGVSRVRYPGLPGDPGHEVAARAMTGFGAMVSFEVAAGAGAADHVCRATMLIRHATSLGGVESTIERRAVLPRQEHVPPSLLRLSVGCEDVEDLWADLAAALASCGEGDPIGPAS
jgi:cystathionine gamma-synthase